MPKFKQIGLANEAILMLWKITEELEELISMANLSFGDLSKLNSFKSNQRKKEWVAVRCLLANYDNKKVFIDYTDTGLPILKPAHFKISISHSHKMVGILLDNNEYTGLDIQVITNKLIKIKNKFLHKKELEYFTSSDSNFEMLLHLIWCAKESAYKAMGIKNLSFSEEIYIPPFDFFAYKTFTCMVKTNKIKVRLTMQFEIIENYLIVYTIN